MYCDIEWNSSSDQAENLVGSQFGKYFLLKFYFHFFIISFQTHLVPAKHLFMPQSGHHDGRRNWKQEGRDSYNSKTIGRLQWHPMWILQSWNGDEHAFVDGIEEWQSDDGGS
jgi:hypothetical protein